jgi:hypothetical protein
MGFASLTVSDSQCLKSHLTYAVTNLHPLTPNLSVIQLKLRNSRRACRLRWVVSLR